MTIHKVVNYKLMILPCALTVVLSACASTGDENQGDWQGTPTQSLESVLPAQPVAAEADYVQLSANAADAYGRGDLDEAETLFETLRTRNPNDPRAVYNLAMLNLQRAYSGLRDYLQLETRAQKKQHAQNLLKRLSELNQ